MDAIVIAVIAAVPGAMTGAAALLHLRRNVGTKNGRGDLFKMVGDLQDTVSEHGERLVRLESRAFRKGAR